jgi:hypothetical protein
VPLREVLNAAADIRWQLLVPVTAAMVLGLYLWDGVCLGTVYSTRRSPLTYRCAIRVRGIAYLVSAFHTQLGNLVVVWNVARMQDGSFVTTLSRGILLAYHDLLLLTATGLIGSLLSPSPLAPRLRWVCGTALVALVAVGLIVASLSRRWRWHFRHTRWGAWMGVWTWGRSARLILLRLVYYAILAGYATAALRICRIDVDQATIFSTVPLVLLADSLPSISGLGARETALQLLLQPENPGALAAMGLMWSTGLIVGRLAIGLAHLWYEGGILLARGGYGEPLKRR